MTTSTSTSRKLLLIGLAAATAGLVLAVLVGLRASGEGTPVVVSTTIPPVPAAPSEPAAPAPAPVVAPPAAPARVPVTAAAAAPRVAPAPQPPAAHRSAAPAADVAPSAVALAPLTIVPVDEAHGGDENALPMGASPRADLTFLSEAARLEKGPPSPAVQRLVALAESGADTATLSTAIDRELADHLALRLTAHRWLAARVGQPVPAAVPPRPAQGVVSGFTH